MGQGLHGGIVYGCIMTKEQEHAVFGADYESGVMEAWSREVQPRFEGNRRERDKYIPDTSYETDERWIGFWVAEIDAALVEDNRCAPLGRRALPLSARAVRETFPRAYKNARIRWRRFARFAAAQGVELKGSLLIVSDYD